MNNKWQFPSNSNAVDIGLNDAGIETFSKDSIEYLVRESIQNSLDAKKDDNIVRVTFDIFEISSDKIPGYASIKDAINKCLSSNKKDSQAQKFFSKAQNILSQENISILKISDYGTVGLLGSENPTDEYTNWYGLIKKEGASNNKTGSSGGSFGIGKNVYFGASNIRTVYFSSYNSAGHKSHIGLAKLISFQEKDYKTLGRGYYSKDNLFNPIDGLLQMLDENRNTYGTDIYLLSPSSELSNKDLKEIKNSVLENFFISIWEEQLIVKVQNQIIDKSSLELYIRELKANSKNSYLWDYYDLLTNKRGTGRYEINLKDSEFAKKFDFNDDECFLHVKVEETEKLNRKVLMSRKNGMRLFDWPSRITYLNFTAIVRIVGNKMNQAFRDMEVASHNGWEPGRCYDKKSYYKEMKEEFQWFIRDSIQKLADDKITDKIDAFGVSDFIKDYTNRDKKEYIINELNSHFTNISVKENNPKNVKKRKNKLAREEIEDIAENNEIITKNEKSNKNENKKSDKEKDEKEYKKFIIEDQNQIFFEKDVKNGEFIYKFIAPKNCRNWKLEFNLVGEQRLNEIKIIDANIIQIDNNKCSIKEIDSNNVFIANLIRGKWVEVSLKIDFNTHCRMEVIHYEAR